MAEAPAAGATAANANANANARERREPPIVVKRVKKAAHGHHGGVWKIAYADFVTAMMAFFLLMWVLGSTTAGDLAGISNYFQNPLRVAVQGGSGSGDATRLIRGGGENIFRTAGQEARADADTPQRKVSDSALEQEYAARETERMERARKELEKQIAADGAVEQFHNQIFMDITADGLRIQIVDEKNRPMFGVGSADLPAHTRRLLQVVGRVLAGMDNRLRIEGHTDGLKFGNGPAGYGNWELSSERANAARRELVAAGIAESRVALIAGYADSVRLNPDDPADPLNRRISITALTGRAPAPSVNQGRGGAPVNDAGRAPPAPDAARACASTPTDSVVDKAPSTPSAPGNPVLPGTGTGSPAAPRAGDPPAATPVPAARSGAPRAPAFELPVRSDPIKGGANRP